MSITRIKTVTAGAVVAAVGVVWGVPSLAQGSASAASITVTAGKPSEFGYILSTKTAKVGSVTFKVTNKGKLPHDFKVCSASSSKLALTCTGKGTATLSPGASANITIKFTKAGSYEYLCTLPGHAAGGMKGTLKVT